MVLIAQILVYFALALPVLTFLFDRWVLPRQIEWPLMTIITWFACVGAVWIANLVLEQGLHNEMISYDLDGDGRVRGAAEETPAARDAIDRWQHDTGRNFGPCLAIPLFAGWTAIVYLALGLLHRAFRSGGAGGRN